MCATAALSDGAALQTGVEDHRDTALAQLLGQPNARVNWDPRAMDGAGRQHYLAGDDRVEAFGHQLDADSPLVLDEDANDSLAGDKGHAA